MFRAMAVDSFVLLLSYSITTGALGSPCLLPPCSIKIISLLITIILTMALMSFYVYVHVCVYIYNYRYFGFVEQNNEFDLYRFKNGDMGSEISISRGPKSGWELGLLSEGRLKVSLSFRGGSYRGYFSILVVSYVSCRVVHKTALAFFNHIL